VIAAGWVSRWEGVYIVPLNFGFKSENGRRTFYFHGAKEGKRK